MRTILGGIVAAAVLASAALAGEGGIAVIDMRSVIDAHPKTESDREILEKQVEAYEAERDRMVEELKTLKTDFEKAVKNSRDTAVSDEVREKRKEVAEVKLEEVTEYQRQVRETLRERQQQLGEQERRMRERVVARIRDTVAEYAGEKGYSLVLDSSAFSGNGGETVVYHDGAVNITDAVIEKISATKTQPDE